MIKLKFNLALLFAISLIGFASCTGDEEFTSEQTNKLIPALQSIEEETDTFAVHAMDKNPDYYSLF